MPGACSARSRLRNQKSLILSARAVATVASRRRTQTKQNDHHNQERRLQEIAAEKNIAEEDCHQQDSRAPSPSTAGYQKQAKGQCSDDAVFVKQLDPGASHIPRIPNSIEKVCGRAWAVAYQKAAQR